MINPDGVRAQVEGNILQTLSCVLKEEVKFNRSRVTSVDRSSYPIMSFSDTPQLEIELIDRPTEPPFGCGDASSTPVAAALANAGYRRDRGAAAARALYARAIEGGIERLAYLARNR
jgi:nicotinate dehydrogenase subunit B